MAALKLDLCLNLCYEIWSCDIHILGEVDVKIYKCKSILIYIFWLKEFSSNFPKNSPLGLK